MQTSTASVKIGLCADVLITQQIRDKMKNLFPEACGLYPDDDEAIGMLVLYHAIDQLIPVIGNNLPSISNITLD